MVTEQLRALLRDNPDGLTLPVLARLLEKDESNVRRCIRKMPDTYIDRWEGPNRGQYAAVWCVVVPPDDCPHPAGKVVAVRPRTGQTATADSQEIND